MRQSANLIHMRITLILDDELLERAREMTGIKEKTRSRMPVWKRSSLVKAKRLAALGGTQLRLSNTPRRRA